MRTRDATFEALTRLTRAARESAEATTNLDAILYAGKLESLVEPAIAVALETGDPIGRRLAKVVASRASPPLATRLMVRLEDEPADRVVSLRELALEVTCIVLKNHRHHMREYASDGVDSQSHRDMESRLLNRLGHRTYQLGHIEVAQRALDEAILIDRELAQLNPEIYGDRLAASLNNHSSTLHGLGRIEEALANLETAIDLLQRQSPVFGGSRDEGRQAQLAQSFHNLADILEELGRSEEALATSGKALRVYRSLACHAPRVYRLRLAETLINHGTYLDQAGQTQEALEATREASRLLARVEADRPGAFDADIAHLQLNLGLFLGECGELGAAEHALTKAEHLYRVLANARPEAFEPDLALCLLNRSRFELSALRYEEAQFAAREAVKILRRLSAARPERFESDLAYALHNLGTAESELGANSSSRVVARSTFAEAVARLRQLAHRRPSSYRADLAASLTVQSAVLGESGDHRKSLAAAREAAEIFRDLSVQEPERFGARFIDAQINLAAALLGCDELAMSEAVSRDILRPDDGRASTVKPDDLARAWNQLSIALSRLTRPKEAVQAAERSVQILSDVGLNGSNDHLLSLASSLANLAANHLHLGDFRLAQTSAESSLRILAEAPAGSEVQVVTIREIARAVCEKCAERRTG